MKKARAEILKKARSARKLVVHKNCIHGTEYASTYTTARVDAICATKHEDRTPAQVMLILRMAKKLCGVAGCKCNCDDAGRV